MREMAASRQTQETAAERTWLFAMQDTAARVPTVGSLNELLRLRGVPAEHGGRVRSELIVSVLERLHRCLEGFPHPEKVPETLRVARSGDAIQRYHHHRFWSEDVLYKYNPFPFGVDNHSFWNNCAHAVGDSCCSWEGSIAYGLGLLYRAEYQRILRHRVRFLSRGRYPRNCVADRHREHLHDVLGPPGAPTVLPPSVLASRDRLVPTLAAAIEAEADIGRLPLLGDALEETGCVEEAILASCRSSFPYRTGRWVLDMAQGRRVVPASPSGD